MERALLETWMPALVDRWIFMTGLPLPLPGHGRSGRMPPLDRRLCRFRLDRVALPLLIGVVDPKADDATYDQ